jgi:hypothetical protein
MAGPVPAIYVFVRRASKMWMPATKTEQGDAVLERLWAGITIPLKGIKL